MRLRRSLLSLLVCALLVPVAGAAAATDHVQVVGGGTATIDQVPWAAWVKIGTGASFGACSGTIIDDRHVVTAAHCVEEENPDGTFSQVVPGDVSVTAGATNAFSPAAGEAPQQVSVHSLRVHPYYFGVADPAAPTDVDDVAVLELVTPLNLTAPGVRAAALPTQRWASGQPARLVGWGLQQVTGPGEGTADGALRTLDVTAYDRGSCGTTVVVCSLTTAGSACYGDSGGGLTVGTSPAVLVGVADAGEEGCAPGDVNLHADVTSPEILQFLRGDDHPPHAPRLDPTPGPSLFPNVLQVGPQVWCQTGSWTEVSSFTYTFEDAATGAVLQSGTESAYRTSPADVGRRLRCRVTATGPGGVGEANVAFALPFTAPPVVVPPQPGPPLPAPVPQKVVKPAAVRIGTHARKARRGARVTIGVAFSAGSTARKATVCLTANRRTLSGVGCRSLRLAAGQTRTVTWRLRVRRTAHLGPTVLRATLRSGTSVLAQRMTLRIVR